MNDPIHLRQHGTFFFVQKCLAFGQTFLNKVVFFHPAGGEIPCRVNDRVRPVIHTSYAVDLQTGRLSRVMAGFACGSIVLLFSCFTKICMKCKFL